MNPENLFDIDVAQLIAQLTNIMKSGKEYGPEFRPVLASCIELLQQVQDQSADSDSYFALGECFLQLEDTNYAEKAFHTAWAMQPTNLQAGTYLGLCLEQAGKIEQAIDTYFTLVKIDPHNVEMANHVMQLLHQQKDIEKLFVISDQMTELNAQLSAPYYYRSKYYFAAGNIKKAFEEISTAHKIEPDNPEFLERFLYFAYRAEEYETVLQYQNELRSDYFNYSIKVILPNSYAGNGDLKKARENYYCLFRNAPDVNSRVLVAIEMALFHASYENNVNKSNRINKWIILKDPSNSIAWSNLANNTSNMALKLEYFKKAYEFESSNHAIAMNYGNTLMNHGQLELGFDLYDRRKFLISQSIANIIKYTDDLCDKKVLIWAEQGIGDAYIYSWLIHRLAKDTDHAKVQCDPRLKSLLSRSIPNIEFIDKNLHEIAATEDLNSFDANMLLISLGKYYINDILDLQNGITEINPSLKADDDLVKNFSDRLHIDDPRPVIGICWRSSVNDYKRDSHYLNYQSVGDIFNGLPCRILNLQYNTTDDEVNFLSSNLPNQFVHFDDIDLRDDQESVAAMMIACDIVFSVPTAVMALAGALGKSVLSTVGSSFFGHLQHPFFPNLISVHTSEIGEDKIKHYRKCISEELDKLQNSHS